MSTRNTVRAFFGRGVCIFRENGPVYGTHISSSFPFRLAHKCRPGQTDGETSLAVALRASMFFHTAQSAWHCARLSSSASLPPTIPLLGLSLFHYISPGNYDDYCHLNANHMRAEIARLSKEYNHYKPQVSHTIV
jgi:hypothetical protein